MREIPEAFLFVDSISLMGKKKIDPDPDKSIFLRCQILINIEIKPGYIRIYKTM